MTALALRRPIPLFALAALLSIVGGLCIGAFPVGFTELLSAIGLSDRPLDDTTAAVLYAIRAPRVIAAFTVGAALAAGGAAMQSLFRNPLADPGGHFHGAGRSRLWSETDLEWPFFCEFRLRPESNRSDNGRKFDP